MHAQSHYAKLLQLAILVGLTAAASACATGRGDPDERTDDALREAPTTNMRNMRWLTFVPKQCRSNPWDRPMPMIAPASGLGGEAGVVDSYFRAHGISLAAVGFLDRPPSSTPNVSCAACQCARGDRLVVRTKNEADAETLVREYDFSRADANVLARAAISCNRNPWDGTTRGTTADLGRWATEEGASVEYAGLVEPTETGGSNCRACTCPRGDHAVAMAEDVTVKEKLVSLEFEALGE